MKYCSNCGSKLIGKEVFCMNCSTKIEKLNLNSDFNNEMRNDIKQNKLTVRGGSYIGRKWFLKIPYKVVQTDVDFSETEIKLRQGSGFASVEYKVPRNISYKSVYEVTTKSKFSVPNIVFACIVSLMGIITEVWAAFLIVAFVLFLGKTAIVTIRYSGGEYIVPTEFMSQAEELRAKIKQAIHQATTR